MIFGGTGSIAPKNAGGAVTYAPGIDGRLSMEETDANAVYAAHLYTQTVLL